MKRLCLKTNYEYTEKDYYCQLLDLRIFVYLCKNMVYNIEKRGGTNEDYYIASEENEYRK